MLTEASDRLAVTMWISTSSENHLLTWYHASSNGFIFFQNSLSENNFRAFSSFVSLINQLL
jgi:hypothetical protein